MMLKDLGTLDDEKIFELLNKKAESLERMLKSGQIDRAGQELANIRLIFEEAGLDGYPLFVSWLDRIKTEAREAVENALNVLLLRQ